MSPQSLEESIDLGRGNDRFVVWNEGALIGTPDAKGHDDDRDGKTR